MVFLRLLTVISQIFHMVFFRGRVSFFAFDRMDLALHLSHLVSMVCFLWFWFCSALALTCSRLLYCNLGAWSAFMLILFFC